jgi:nicotinate-nucleotide adenylyltransferase
MIRTGIYGGSFNPIHMGHIALAKQLLELVSLDEIWFVVSPLNPFKKSSTTLLDDARRLQITQTALTGERALKASDFEFKLSKPSYMWNTLQRLSNEFPNREFTLIIGADNWLAFERWKNYRDIIANYRIVIYPRKNSPIDKDTLPENVILADTPLYNISSTEIRRRVSECRPLKDLIPDNIIPLVEKYYK